MIGTSFEILLFRSAFAVMACDGEIHEDEISIFRSISNSNPYFADLNFEKELDIALNAIKSQGIHYINQILESLKSLVLKEKQKLLLIEVILKIMDADKKVDENELKFLKTITNILDISEEILIMKFPTHINAFLNMSDFSANLSFKVIENNIDNPN
ncbi:MAG: TerB family tellurite resistance protein [Calditrichaceae bacterium]